MFKPYCNKCSHWHWPEESCRSCPFCVDAKKRYDELAAEALVLKAERDQLRIVLHTILERAREALRGADSFSTDTMTYRGRETSD